MEKLASEKKSGDAGKEGEDKKPKTEFDKIELKTEIKRMSMDQWQPSRGFDRIDIRSNVLVVYYKTVVQSKKDNTDSPAPRNTKQVPQRVQINSRPLLDELEFITGTTMARVPCVMIPPFKVFVSLRDKIKQEMEAKKKALSQESHSDAEPTEVTPVTLDQHNAAAEKERQKTAASHMECLLNFIDTELKDTLELRKEIENGTLQKIAFDELWHLFRPGDVVFSAIRTSKEYKELSYQRAFRVHAVSGGRPNISGKAQLSNGQSAHSQSGNAESEAQNTRDLIEKPAQSAWALLRLGLHYIDYDGLNVGPQGVDEFSANIRKYEGKKDILDLEFYPAKFHPKRIEIYEKLVERGARVKNLLTPSHKMYDALSTDVNDPEHVNGEVIVDFRTGYTMADRSRLRILDIGGTNIVPMLSTNETFELTGCGTRECLGCTNNYDDTLFDRKVHDDYYVDYYPESLEFEESEHEITKEYLLLMSRDVLAYALRSRKWHQILDINEENAKRESGFEELVINERNKKLVLALVESHFSDVRPADDHLTMGNVVPVPPEKRSPLTSMDLVQGKGRGLVILLHGVPGVGKTSTAETVAAYTKKPLYPITCGDIGESAEKVEVNLERHFKLANQWGCVLLLDEADVFLAKRESKDIKRNAMVSVFLRTLEYYSGILFLTTNRVGVIDEAFKSRIRLQLYYPHLDKLSTTRIWENSLNLIQRSNEHAEIKIGFNRKKLLEYSERHFEENLNIEPRKGPSATSWNGRQIRNAFQTAIAIAQYDRLQNIKNAITDEHLSEAEAKAKYNKIMLTKAHFKQVADINRDYYDYVKKIYRGKDDDDLAYSEQLRAPDGPPTPSPFQAAMKSRLASPATSTKADRPRPTTYSSSEDDGGDDENE
ncbi:hypothetical protein GTA08_BOTSDO03283 [Botryosphaeria dothidea]|uniref:AAA+ ATPase domain-containing protein n=1 Tax=Botryosphaeria dothidea TaxID=55169 RepID=A0A8H4IY84_9PEZI|nr:hypothetical protein GTA08_BOTSDO03283 [Botryosphaeria dothidea]